MKVDQLLEQEKYFSSKDMQKMRQEDSLFSKKSLYEANASGLQLTSNI